MQAFLFLTIVAFLKSSIGAPYEQYGGWRVVGGQNATDKAFPYQASLTLLNGFSFCGGFIITKRTVVTAAHCVIGRSVNDYKVIIGTNVMNDGSGYHINPVGHLLHPEYNSTLYQNDIALVFVPEDIVYNEDVQPIALDRNGTGGGVEVTLSGWGRLDYQGHKPRNLQYINLLTIDNDQCRSMVGSLGPIFDSTICTFTKEGQGACSGDSGGPIAAKGKVIGVVNWSSPCARGIPDMYARISSHVSWIDASVIG